MNIDDSSGNGSEREEFPDHRSGKQIRIDRVRVQCQVTVLKPEGSQRRIDQIIEQIRVRQDAAPAPYALPFDRFPATDSAGRQTFVLVARGELIVRVGGDSKGPADDRSAARGTDIERIMRELGYRPGDPTVSPRDRRTRVFRGRSRPKQLARDIEKLRGQGITASANLIVPLGHIIKGDDYPFATTSPGPYPPANSSGNTGTDVRVAVIDTGITAEDRTDDWLDSIQRGPGDTDPVDILPDDGHGNGDGRVDWWAGHGSFAAGIVQRVAPDCQIVAYRFTRSDGLGTEKEVAETMIRAAEDGDRDGVRLIINASLGTPGINGAPPLALSDAVALIEDRYPDVLIVASAGNTGAADPMYPAALGDVVAVGALTDDLLPAPFSNHGYWVDCSTVGVGVVSTFVAGTVPPEPDPAVPDYTFGADSWAVWTGTSFSAPQISGAVARLCQNNPGQQPRAALESLLTGLPEIPGYGRVLRVLPGTPI